MLWLLTRICAAAAAALLCLAAVPPAHVNSGSDHGTPSVRKTPKGNLGATMPAAAISSSDSLPVSLHRGRRYELVIHVGVAGGQPRTGITVALTGADRAVCLARMIPAGAITTLRCAFVPTHVGAVGLRVNVLVVAGNHVPVIAIFDHPVVATGSSE